MVLSENVRDLVEQSLQKYQIPGLTMAVARASEPPVFLCVGTDRVGVPLQENTLFPVASITKLATALAILRLADLEALDWNDALSLHLPDAAAAQAGVDIRSLMTHTSGLPDKYLDEEETYQLGLSWQEIAAACLRTPLVQPPYTSVAYGSVSYSLLAVVVERITGQTFAEALTSLVFTPLGIEGYLGVEPPRTPATIDVDGTIFAGTALEFFNSTFFRSLGEPGAGLITTAAGVLALIRAFQSSTSSFLKPSTAAAATQNQVGRLGGGVSGWFTLPYCPWGLGPALFKTFPCVPSQASPRSFGHTGASGCMVWSDPLAEVAWTLFVPEIAKSEWFENLFPQIGSVLLTSN